MKYSEEDIDIMLFDYLEGNLPGSEIKEVENQIASDPLVQEEFNIWKQSYIQADLYPTTGLESQLLQSPGSFSFTLFLNSVLLICLTIISGTNPKPDPFSTSTIPRQTISSLDALKPDSHISFQNITIQPQQIILPEDISPLQETVIKDTEAIAPVTPIPEIANLALGWMEYGMDHPVSIEINTTNSPVITQKVLRREERALRRMKEKALRERMASEFMKGDIPYVVPIDTQNF